MSISSTCAGNISTLEYQALYDFYNSTNGPGWKLGIKSTPWTFPSSLDAPCSGWVGLRCDWSASSQTCAILEITLNSMELVGQVPPTLRDFVYLEDLSIMSNSLSGPLLEQLINPNLKAVLLTNNKFSGFIGDGVCDMTSLSNFEINKNSFSRSLPACLGNISSLEVFNVGSNYFTGPIPNSFSQLNNITEMAFFHNSFEGKIATTFGYLELLQILIFSTNSFSGPIPTSICYLTLLGGIYLNSNRLTGPLPTCLGRLTKVEEILVYENSLTGSLSFALEKMKFLINLDLYSNLFSQELPTGITKLTMLMILTFNTNMFTGPLPIELGTLSRLKYLYGYYNSISGPLPTSLGNLNSLLTLNLYCNSLTYSLPTSIGGLQSLIVIDFYSNYISGPIPSSIGLLSNNLELISFSTNLLTSSIPSSVGMLINVNSLVFSTNSLTGPLPSSFGNMVMLVSVYLFSNFLSFSVPEEITKLTNIQSLMLYSNRFSGPLPSLLGVLDNMLFLVISSNSFSGSLPKPIIDVGEMIIANDEPVTHVYSSQAIGWYDISTIIGFQNSFTGSIPSSYGLLNSLIIFNILDNLLSGEIFSTFSKMLSLSVLSIAGNHFEGSLVPIEAPLTVLNVGDNCLSGEFPYHLCSLSSLQTLVLDNMGCGQQCSAGLSLLNTNISPRTSKIFGTFPNCLLALPKLSTLHVVGNNLYGHLDESYIPLNSSLLDIAFMSNFLTGSFPNQFQQGDLFQILISNNRFNGKLESNSIFSTNINESNRTLNCSDITVKMSSNRLSGNLPISWQNLSNMDVIEGNIFSCQSKYSNDQHANSYTCGSIRLTQVWIAYVLVGIVLILFGGFIFPLHWNKIYCYRQKFVEYYDQWWTGIESMQKNNVDTDSTNNSFKRMAHDVFTEWLSSRYFFFVSIIWLGISLGIICGMKYSSRFSTHSVEYGWMFSFANSHGILPCVVLISSLYLYCCWNGLIITPFLKKQQSLSTSSSSFKENTSMFTSCYSWWISSQGWAFVVCLVFNVILLLGLNIFYVAVVLVVSDQRLQLLCSVLLGCFKWGWNLVVYYIIVEWFSHWSLHRVIVLDFFLGIFNYLICPTLVMYTTGVNCFYYSLVGIDSISFDYLTLTYYCTNSVDVQQNVNVSCTPINTIGSITIDPPWVYSYQCGSDMIMTYVPVIFFAYLINFLISPLVRLSFLNRNKIARREFLQKFPSFVFLSYFSYSFLDWSVVYKSLMRNNLSEQRSNRSSSYVSSFNSCDTNGSSMIDPWKRLQSDQHQNNSSDAQYVDNNYNENNLKEINSNPSNINADNQSATNLKDDKVDIAQLERMNTRYRAQIMSRFLRHGVMLITFGLAFPFLGVAILATIIMESWLTELEIGMGISDLEDFIAPLISESAVLSGLFGAQHSSLHSFPSSVDTFDDCRMKSNDTSTFVYDRRSSCPRNASNVNDKQRASVLVTHVKQIWYLITKRDDFNLMNSLKSSLVIAWFSVLIFWSIFVFDMVADVKGNLWGGVTVGLFLLGGILLIIASIWSWNKKDSLNSMSHNPAMSFVEMEKF